MSRLVAIDPGKHASAMAYFADRQLLALHSGPFMPSIWSPIEIVVELPEVYRRQKAKPSDLIDLAFAAGRAIRPGVVVTMLRPKEWKGQTPKAINHERAWRVLTADEMTVFDLEVKRLRIRPSQLHNLRDAVALGLKHLGRVR